jgi:transcriptional regulator with XRE-family HTH domain
MDLYSGVLPSTDEVRWQEGNSMDPLALRIGRALRGTRRERGLTLREVASLSGGLFKATSIAGYERGERSISLERFCILCRIYGIAPERLLADILRAPEERLEPVIDLTLLEDLTPTEGALFSRFVRQVISLRRQPTDTIAVRAGDVAAIATASGRRADELMQALGTVRRRED